MNHPTEDRLLELALDMLDTDEAQVLREHLKQCTSCRASFEKIKSVNAVLGGIRPNVVLPALPKRRARTVIWQPLLKAAALLLVGFLGGFAAADWLNPPLVNVIPSYIETSSPPDSIARCAASDATDWAAVQY